MFQRFNSSLVAVLTLHIHQKVSVGHLSMVTCMIGGPSLTEAEAVFLGHHCRSMVVGVIGPKVGS
jgi:hypothetical protein